MPHGIRGSVLQARPQLSLDGTNKSPVSVSQLSVGESSYKNTNKTMTEFPPKKVEIDKEHHVYPFLCIFIF